MLFTQFEFVLLFLPAVLFLHETMRGSLARTRLLVIASILFYSAWDVRFLPMVVVSVLGNFVIGKALLRERSRRVLTGGIVFNLLPLAYCKYGAFLLENFGIPVDPATAATFFPAAIPLGISFYTFQQIAYLVDVYKDGLAERSLTKYSFFTLFFPQLIAGPIVHHRQIIPQIGRPCDRSALWLAGIVYFAIGYVKKFFIADALGAMVDPLYASSSLVLQESLVATLGYTFQLYFDFSGYSDMAMGLGALFGFRLPVNFDSPYKATSITDFWRRWHITLSQFLRDYVYIPFGGNRHGALKRYRNLMLTMLIGGLWHGAGWTFVFWGGAHGLLLTIES
ncbi:MAG: MBOAT family protein, partial [Gammaproteobacteria bacterium]|nr:MBOAT family protein [Gammaproteobacteria bacterium]